MDRLRQDLRYTFRNLSRSPGFTAVVVITLALGIGANSTIFSTLDTVLLTPLPYADPDRLVRVLETTAWSGNTPFSAAEFLHLQQNSRSLETIAAFDQVDFHHVTGQRPERLPGALVSVNFFQMLGIKPHLGRLFGTDEGQVGRNRVAVVSHGFWQRRLGADPEVLGRELKMRWNASFGPSRQLDEVFTVIGVLPPDYVGPSGARDIWVPLAFAPEDIESHNHYLVAFARLGPQVTLTDAVSEVSQHLHSLERPAKQVSAHQEEPGVSMVSLPERAVGRVRPVLHLLSAAVGLVLLIACANVANLLLTRANSRRREITLRRVLGATRGRLMHQLLVESLVLSGLGALLGLALAWGGVRALRFFDPVSLPRLGQITIDHRVLAFTLVLAVLTGLLFGLAPAFGAGRFRSAAVLHGSARATSGHGSSATRGALVVVETASASMLLIAAGLLLQSFHRLREFPLGFDTASVLSFEVSLPVQTYGEAHQREAFLRSARDRLEALPGVDEAALLLGRWLESFLFGVEAADLTTYVAIPLVLLTTAGVATLIPARRASRVEPSQALRHDG